MNIFNHYHKLISKIITKNNKFLKIKDKAQIKNFVVESPPVQFDCDLSCNISLVLAKDLGQNPRELAITLKDLFKKEIDDFEKIEIAGPGFLNINLNEKTIKKIIKDILLLNKKYGSTKQNQKYNIEFVSANPTGPMHIGHCRGAIFGDVLSNLLKFNGNKVVKEYYINDVGSQIDNFTESVFFRIKEIKLKEKFPKQGNLYPGSYIIEIAKKILKKKPNIKLNSFKNLSAFIQKESLKISMNMIKTDLKKLGIKHDKFFSEKNLIKKDLVYKSVKLLQNKNFVEKGFLEQPKGEEQINWKKTKRLIFKSSLFGDDTDRALQKNDGKWTYFASDVAYHYDKIMRNFDHLINILGADHTGYVKRITSAVKALSNDKILLECKVCQLVKLFKNGQPFKMSKRAGDFISASDLLKEVNKDFIRFMMLNRSNDVEIDFDFDKVLEKTKDNPVFYVQYCYARVNSLYRNLKLNNRKNIQLNKTTLNFNKYEVMILRKIFEWPKVIEVSSKKLEPHRISYYLYDLATLFHSYWSMGNKNDEYLFISKGKIKDKTLVIINLLCVTIENGMKILGVSLPKKM